jgi:hypothetical protein
MCEDVYWILISCLYSVVVTFLLDNEKNNYPGLCLISRHIASVISISALWLPSQQHDGSAVIKANQSLAVTWNQIVLHDLMVAIGYKKSLKSGAS